MYDTSVLHITVLTGPTLPLLEGISGFLVHTGRIVGCVLKQWNSVLLWIQSGSRNCWLPLSFIEQVDLMPTMKPLPHYPSACQDQAHTDAQTAIHPIQIYWGGRLARGCVNTRSHRLVESSGGGWMTADDLLIATVCCAAVQSLPCRMLSPLNRIHYKTTSPKQVDGQPMVLDVRNCGTSVAFLFTI